MVLCPFDPRVFIALLYAVNEVVHFAPGWETRHPQFTARVKRAFVRLTLSKCTLTRQAVFTLVTRGRLFDVNVVRRLF